MSGDVIILHCEDESGEKRDELLLALYWLLSQVQRPAEGEEGGQGEDDQAGDEPVPHHSLPSHSHSHPHDSGKRGGDLHDEKTGDVVPVSAPLPPSPSTFPPPSTLPMQDALQLLESGTDFTVFLVDRANPMQTSRHPVVLWWIPDSSAGKGR